MIDRKTIALIWASAMLCSVPTILFFLVFGVVAPVVPFCLTLLIGLPATIFILFIMFLYGTLYWLIFFGISYVAAGFVDSLEPKLQKIIVGIVTAAILSVAFFSCLWICGTRGFADGDVVV